METTLDTQEKDESNRDRHGPLVSFLVHHDETGKHIFTVSAALDNEEDREAAEAAVRQEAHRRLQDGDWVQDEHYILGGA